MRSEYSINYNDLDDMIYECVCDFFSITTSSQTINESRDRLVESGDNDNDLKMVVREDVYRTLINEGLWNILGTLAKKAFKWGIPAYLGYKTINGAANNGLTGAFNGAVDGVSNLWGGAKWVWNKAKSIFGGWNDGQGGNQFIDTGGSSDNNSSSNDDDNSDSDTYTGDESDEGTITKLLDGMVDFRDDGLTGEYQGTQSKSDYLHNFIYDEGSGDVRDPLD